jgi:hypothetical protein
VVQECPLLLLGTLSVEFRPMLLSVCCYCCCLLSAVAACFYSLSRQTFDATRCTRTQVAGILMNDIKLLGQSLDSDVIIEPVRAPLIPGMLAVKAAAKAAGQCLH